MSSTLGAQCCAQCVLCTMLCMWAAGGPACVAKLTVATRLSTVQCNCNAMQCSQRCCGSLCDYAMQCIATKCNACKGVWFLLQLCMCNATTQWTATQCNACEGVVAPTNNGSLLPSSMGDARSGSASMPTKALLISAMYQNVVFRKVRTAVRWGSLVHWRCSREWRSARL